MHNAAWISPSSRGPARMAPSSLLLLPIAAKENQYVNTHRKCWVLTLQGNVCLSLHFCSVCKRGKKTTVPSLSHGHWVMKNINITGIQCCFLALNVTGTFLLFLCSSFTYNRGFCTQNFSFSFLKHDTHRACDWGRERSSIYLFIYLSRR